MRASGYSRKKKPSSRSRARRLLILFAVLLIVGGIAGAWLFSQVTDSNEEAAQTPESSETAGESSGGSTVDHAFLPPAGDEGFDLKEVPAYSGEPSVPVNGNKPFFLVDITQDKKNPAEWLKNLFKNNGTDELVYEFYGDLDELGRCTVAEACLGEASMPTEPRGAIQNIRPTGWHTVKYAGIEGNYLYNRCHLIAYVLSGENDNILNLITGTRALNTEGMEPYELEVMSYLYRTGNHVLYRVTPVFEGKELVARGVLMEAYSLEDRGKGICFCVYGYNEQPGVTIDHATGESSGPVFVGLG